MGTEKRAGAADKAGDVPGPGSYNPRLSEGNPKFGFGSAHQRPGKKAEMAPGPGAYRVPCHIADVPVYSGGAPLEEFKFV